MLLLKIAFPLQGKNSHSDILLFYFVQCKTFVDVLTATV